MGGPPVMVNSFVLHQPDRCSDGPTVGALPGPLNPASVRTPHQVTCSLQGGTAWRCRRVQAWRGGARGCLWRLCAWSGSPAVPLMGRLSGWDLS